MKYIRTKDGNILKGSNYGFGVGMPYKNYDVKVADTIEELFDEKVLIEENGYPTLLEIVEFDRNIYLRINEYEFGTHLPSNPIIYGAIWTYDSNGAPTLKPVAKMNDKREWELL